jgi:hypothetical protein
LGILAAVGLLEVARELIVERSFEADSMEQEALKANLMAAVHPGEDAR